MEIYFCKEHNAGGTAKECSKCLEESVKSPHDLGWALAKASELGFERGVIQGKREELLRVIEKLDSAGIMTEVEAFELLKDGK